MLHRWAALACVLALCAVPLNPAAGQRAGTPPRGRRLGTLGQNYPNPFKPDTFIPFSIEDCNGPGGQRVVSLHVYNVLAQKVATPVLFGARVPLSNVRLSCGAYTGYWDGRGPRSTRRATTGVYVYELVVDGQKSARKMFFAK